MSSHTRKKSASWQLVAVGKRPKTTQSAKKRRKIAKTNQNQSKKSPKRQVLFFGCRRYWSFSRYVATYSYVSLPSWVSIATTLRHTYSWIVSRKLRSEVMTLVTFSTMLPTSCLSWSMVMGRPIMEVRQVCRVTRLVATYHTISSCVIAFRGASRNFRDT